jgi:hypothetical protein
LRGFTWKDSVTQLREAYPDKKAKKIGLLISEMALRWKENKFADFTIIPLHRPLTGVIGPGIIVSEISPQIEPEKVVRGGKQIHYQEPYSSLLVIRAQIENVDDFVNEWMNSINIGPAISSIMSFIMRCAVVAYNEFGPPISGKETSPQLIFTGRDWSNIWERTFRGFEGLRERAASHHPPSQMELEMIKTMTHTYRLLMNAKDEDYYSITAAMRLYQLSHLVAREDQSLAYALLVASIDSLSCRGKRKRFREIDEEGKISDALEKAGLDQSIQTAVESLITQGVGLKESFSRFIIDNLPDTFWEGDYSLSRELDMISEQHFSGQYLRDLSESLPEPERTEMLKQAEEQQKQYELAKSRKPRNNQVSTRNKEHREFMLNYLSRFFDRVLKNTYDSRSDLFHRGKGFPKKALDREFLTGGLPVLAEDDMWEFMEKHGLHGKVDYVMNEKNGIITRICACGNKRQVKMMLEIGVFEKIVHDSVLNYLVSTLSQSSEGIS